MTSDKEIDRRHAIIKQAEKWAATSGLSCYTLISDEGAAGYITFKVTRGGGTCTVIAVGIKKHQRVDVFQGKSTGYGFDKQTAALGGWNLNGTILKDNGHTWQRQLENAGYEVIRTL